MAANQDVANFLIIGAIPGSDPPNHNYVYPPNSTEYTFVVSAIGIGLKMMEHPQTQEVMTALALVFDQRQMLGTLFGGSQTAAAAWVSWFVGRVKQAFPVVFIHEGTTNPDILGFHQRIGWEGGLADFVPRAQYVMLNAGVRALSFNHQTMSNFSQRIRDMLASINNGDRFRTFQFIFATTIVHEVGAHLLITFLCNGRELTPPSISAPGYARSDDGGESGRFLETYLFGGTSEFYRDPRIWQDNSQVSHICVKFQTIIKKM